MNIVFRTDSSRNIGTGHVMRCLTLAKRLSQKGISISFVCRDFEGNMTSIIREQGYGLHLLRRPSNEGLNQNQDLYRQWLGVDVVYDASETIRTCAADPPIDWLIVDHYALDLAWELQMRNVVDSIFVIDDLANRHHEANILLDQNLYHNMYERYCGLVPSSTKLLLGPQFALLRPEFQIEHNKRRIRDGMIRRILVFFGGVDASNETEKAIVAIEMLHLDITVDVVVSKVNLHLERIRSICATKKTVNFYCQVNNMAELMGKADLAIGAGGTTTWERCYLGLPSFITVLADNQVEVSESVDKAKAAVNLGWFTEITSDSLANSLRVALNSPDMMQEMSRNARALMGDGCGAERVSSIILGGAHDSDI